MKNIESLKEEINLRKYQKALLEEQQEHYRNRAEIAARFGDIEEANCDIKRADELNAEIRQKAASLASLEEYLEELQAEEIPTVCRIDMDVYEESGAYSYTDTVALFEGAEPSRDPRDWDIELPANCLLVAYDDRTNSPLWAVRMYDGSPEPGDVYERCTDPVYLED